VLLNVQTGAVTPDFSATEAYRLAAAPTYGDPLIAPVQWLPVREPLAPAVLSALLERACHAARDGLASSGAAAPARAERLLALDRARLDAYYGDLERDLERRAGRATDDGRRAGVLAKLEAARADHVAKLADAEAKHRLRVELELINLAVIAQPKLTLAMRVSNRESSASRVIVWDPLRSTIEPLACEACFRPVNRLYLCVHGHLVCADCLAPQCVDCKRVYCRACAHELDACVVCHRPVCRKSLTHCDTCGQGTCREHAGQCHAPRPAPAAVPPAPEPELAQTAELHKAPATRAAASKPAARRQTPGRGALPRAPLKDPGYRVEVEILLDQPRVTAFVIGKKGREVAQRSWALAGQGIAVTCRCDAGADCQFDGRFYNPAEADEIESQLSILVEGFCAEYHVPAQRVTYLTVQYGEVVVRLRELRLRGAWKDERVLAAARVGFGWLRRR
jgi:hypothetical protein